MTRRTKILLTLLLAVLAFNLVRERFVRILSATSVGGDVDVQYLTNLYAVYNESYFGNKLTKTPKIDMNETKFMASTMCNDGMTDCVIHFNPKYILAPRVSDFTMLHEQCHIKTWETDVKTSGEQADHGRVWRSCMLQLDAEGAFREIIIDHFQEDM